MAIRVRATQDGYFGNYKQTGEEFDIENEKQFSERWMARVESTPPPKSESKKEK